MTDKMSPTEFLASLKAGFSGKSAAASQATATSETTPVEDDALLDNLDFGDLDEDEGATDEASDEVAGSSGKTSAEATGESDQEDANRTVTTELSKDELDAVRQDAQLFDLFDRVNSLLGPEGGGDDDVFRPKVPETMKDTGLTHSEVEQLILKALFASGQATGRQLCMQIKLPFPIVDGILKEMKQDQLVHFRGTAAMGDYEFAITDFGRDRARRYTEECSYFGAAPVVLRDYLHAMERQSIAKQHCTEVDLEKAFEGLIISPDMLDKLGPAINSGRGMFLFGEPGNGKTSIAERVTGCFGSNIWIPRALSIHGEIVRLFDPGVHEEVPFDNGDGLFDLSGIDQRWVQVVRPTVIAGGELTMRELEIAQNKETKVCEAPLQLKSNCGTLVIDDFGRQTMPVDVLLNRWIVPLEKRYDFLNMPSGKKIQVPFDQLIVFSTNLEPKDLVDGAFLRRIPYKIEVVDPSEEAFYKLFEIMAPHMGFEYDHEAVKYLVETHYRAVNRPFRACQPRDLLLQVRNYCVYKQTAKRMTREAFDFAVSIYFSIM